MIEGDAMSAAEESTIDRAPTPNLYRDPAFWGMTSTQFLGAFNDNVFKQLILLLAVRAAVDGAGTDLQGMATMIFAAPFVLFSGFAGFLADRNSKRTIVVLCKVSEIAIMLLGVVVFALGSLPVVFCVLFLMGMQSAFFGPAKYGILPEMLRSSDLPRANGVIQMTTFLAIILGVSLAGFLVEYFGARLWAAAGCCVAIAIVGTGTSLLVRRTSIASPALAFDPSIFAIGRDTFRLLRGDLRLAGVLALSMLFWFIGGMVQQTVNKFGLEQLRLGAAQTSRMAAMIAIGIAVGCVVAGKLSAGRIGFRLVRIGAVGIVGCLLALAAPTVIAGPASIWHSLSMVELVALGFFAGLFAVPLQVYLQATPPADQKGRIIGTMNLINWIGILGAGAFYHGSVHLAPAINRTPSALFAVVALVMAPVALLFRAPDVELSGSAGAGEVRLAQGPSDRGIGGSRDARSV